MERITTIALWAVLLILRVGAGAATYSIADLGTLGGSFREAYGVNDKGQIVGSSTTAGDAAISAFVWDPKEGMWSLGHLGGGTSDGFGINSKGQAVGSSTTPAGDYHAFLWLPEPDYGLPAGMNDLHALGGDWSYAFGINGAGRVTGCSWFDSSQRWHAFLWDPAAGMRDLGTLPGDVESSASAINNKGEIVGYSQTAAGTTRAFIWLPVPAYGLPAGMNSLGTLPGGSQSSAAAINDKGQVVGCSKTASGSQCAFLWLPEPDYGLPTGMSDFGTLPGCVESSAHGINIHGQVVGQSAGSAGEFAFVWDCVNRMRNLGGLSQSGYTSALAVETAGRVVGWSERGSGESACLWTPSYDGIAASKTFSDSALVDLGPVAVTAAFDGFFYVEDADRSCGIRVEKASHGLTAGRKALVVGSVQTNADGERFIAAGLASPGGWREVAPIGMAGRWIGGGPFLAPTGSVGQEGVNGGFGLNNVGLLVRLWGEVSYVGSDHFYLDDGSGLREGSTRGIRVSVPAGFSVPALGDWVAVTGISSCRRVAAELHRLILLRTEDDTTTLH